VGFCGGLDVTLRRWDRIEHRLDDPLRVDAAGLSYGPFHDVQAMVDGKAARALAEYVRTRWRRGTCRRPPALRPVGDPWAKSVRPDLTNVDVGIARTHPEFEEQPPAREVEALFFDSIDHAERTIYIENQFMTCTRFAERLATRMRAKPGLEALIVAPKVHDSWIPERTMINGRARFMRILSDAGIADRVRLFYPEVREGERTGDTKVHSKVMIVDDVLLRIGSANLNNRSMGLDTECDLAIEARSEADRTAITRTRDSLLAHHCGATVDEIHQSLLQTGSLVATAEHVSERGHRLVPIPDDDTAFGPWLGPVHRIADPEEPIAAPVFLRQFIGARPSVGRFWRLIRIFGAAFALAGLILSWHLTPLADLVRPEVVQAWLDAAAQSSLAPVIVTGAFVAGGLVAFPVTVLIAATAATFGPWLGLAYAATGTIASAIITYFAGATLGRGVLEDVLGPRLYRIRRMISRRGMLAVAAVRLVPIAPFTLVNLVAGASRIPIQDYIVGTIVGMAPGMIVLSILGFQILSIIMQPTVANVLLFLAAVIGWVGLSVGVQAILLRARSRRS